MSRRRESSPYQDVTTKVQVSCTGGDTHPRETLGTAVVSATPAKPWIPGAPPPDYGGLIIVDEHEDWSRFAIGESVEAGARTLREAKTITIRCRRCSRISPGRHVAVRLANLDRVMYGLVGAGLRHLDISDLPDILSRQ